MSTVNTTCNSIKIKWEAESSQNYPIQTYFIYVNETKIEINNNNNNVLEYNITNLASGEIYNISISGNYSYGETNIIYKMIKACTPNRIIDCSITFNNNNTVNGNIYDIIIDWEYQNNNDGYTCDISKENIEIYKIYKNDVSQSDNKLFSEENLIIHKYENQMDLTDITKIIVSITSFDENDIKSTFTFDKSFP